MTGSEQTSCILRIVGGRIGDVSRVSGRPNGQKAVMSTLTKPTEADLARPRKLMDEAYIHLEKMIVTGELKPGQWVSETELIEVSGFSRAPVRSAIQRLADQQLIDVHPRRGAQVCPIDFTQQFRALELRRVLERLVVRCAAKRANAVQKQEFAELSAAFRAAAEAGDQTPMTELDFRTIALILEAADNAFAIKSLTSVKGLSRRFWILHHEEYGDTSRMATAHADVTEALSRGAVEEAEKCFDALMDYVEYFTMRVVGYDPTR